MAGVDGRALYDRVEAYAAFGDHRTGTDVDHATARWIVDGLRARGLSVEAEPLPFDRWVASSRLAVDGADVPHLPVPYEWTGSLTTAEVRVTSFDPMGGGFPELIDQPVRDARDGGAEAVVLATQHPNGSLVAVNRVPGAGSGFPTVLAAGADLERLRSGAVTVTMEARIEPGVSTNVVASNGIEGDPLLLTTPLTGWFRCAGERGTGIGVLFHLVDRFADRPLLVVATGGHELDCFGARRWVADNDVAAAAVVHLGASLAVEEDAPDGGRRLASTRLALTSLGDEDAGPIAAALRGADLDLITATTRWLGEGEAWSGLDAPLLSLTGAGTDFHTPGDVPDAVTSPAALAAVAAAVGDAVAALDDTAR